MPSISRPLAVLVAKINGSALNASNYQYQVVVEQTAPDDSQIEYIFLKQSDMMKVWGTNLTAITWAHAVNSQQLLDEVLTETSKIIGQICACNQLINGIISLPKVALTSSKRTLCWAN